MLTNDDIAALRASAQAAIDNPTRPFTVAPEVAVALLEQMRLAEQCCQCEGDIAKQSMQAARRYEAVRKLNPRQFAELYQRKLRGESFDALVDELGAK